MDYLPKYKDNEFDLCIVDPPYGIGDFQQKEGKGTSKYNKQWDICWNDEIPKEEYFIQLKRISRKSIIWGAIYYNCFDGGAIVWDKDNRSGRGSESEIASVSWFNRVVNVKIPWTGIEFVNRKIPNIHPCQKSVALYKWLLKNYAKLGDKILDTHVGSGSSRIACHEMGFEFIGFEIDVDYYNAQEKRYKEYIKQLNLFDVDIYHEEGGRPRCDKDDKVIEDCQHDLQF